MAPEPHPRRNVPSTRSEAVADELRRLIALGELAPGTRLRQADIAERFMVSTTPVREAFASLAREGLVRQDAHRGVVVSAPSAHELRETFEIRGVLESFATRLAAERLTAEDLAGLEELVLEMRDATSGRYIELNRLFHRRIYDAAGRPRLVEIIEQLREIAGNDLNITVRRYGEVYRHRVQSEHAAIVDALANEDGELASRLVSDHVRQLTTLIVPSAPPEEAASAYGSPSPEVGPESADRAHARPDRPGSDSA
jgi:DNA-binding GntR family transcriptional regulator